VKVVTTYTGNGGGYLNGALATAQFNFLHALTRGFAGDLFVADLSNGCIRRITTGGTVSTFSGTNSTGRIDGPAGTARFNGPSDIAFGPDQFLYVADSDNHSIRKIASDGSVTTLAGTGAAVTRDGNGEAAGFNAPRSLAIEPDGTMYVCEEAGNVIRKVTPAGDVTTIAGTGQSGFVDGAGTSASFSGPRGLALDGKGGLYVIELGNDAIRRIDLKAGGYPVTTVAGTGQAGYLDAVGKAAKFNDPRYAEVDPNGFVYIADTGNHRIRRLDPATGAVTTVAGSGTPSLVDGSGTAAGLNEPRGLVIEADGNILFCDSANHAIRKLTP
jgi:streptogramin lyase